MSRASSYIPSREWLTSDSLHRLENYRRNLILWFPVAMGMGVSIYFSVPSEPSAVAALFSLIFATLLIGFAANASAVTLAVALGLAGGSVGFGLATFRTAHVAAPILVSETSTTVEGRLRAISRSASGNPRILLDDVVLYGSGEQPGQIRVALTHGSTAEGLRPGDRVRLFAHLSPPAAPTEPGGYDFRRHAYYEGLGAVGYTSTPVLRIGSDAAPPFDIRILHLRHGLAEGIKTVLPGRTGGFAAAILVGDRSDIPTETLEDLRAANLAHLLAISGLHMGLVTGFVFAVIRYGLALIPRIALTVPTKKVAALVALAAALIFLVVSGASVATQRAFVMAAVVLGAVLVDRPAFTLRAVALAATVILILRPESLVSPGFQMSFAATTALVATFDILRRREWWRDADRGWVTRLRPLLSLTIASLVAGLATAPFGAFHFNQMSSYGLIANLIAVPLMSFFVMPLGVIAALLAPLGAAPLPLEGMGIGIEFILRVAEWVASLPGATTAIKAGPTFALACITLGGVLFCLARGLWRFGSVPLIMLGLVTWSLSPRPDILISADGKLVGVLTEAGRALSQMRGNGFVADAWAEHDGQPMSREDAVALWSGERRRDRAYFSLADTRIQWTRDATPACTDENGYLVVVTVEHCASVGASELSQGAVAIFLTQKGPVLRQDPLRNRPWLTQ